MFAFNRTLIIINSGATTTTTATGFGTLGATTSGASIFGTPVTKTTASGLGGVDPKTTTTAAGTTTDGTKTRWTDYLSTVKLLNKTSKYSDMRKIAVIILKFEQCGCNT